MKIALIVLSICCVSLNAAASALDLQELSATAPVLKSTVTVGSYFLFVLCIVTGCILVIR